MPIYCPCDPVNANGIFCWMNDVPQLSIVFAQLLRECREKHGYSQRKLAAAIGCARSYIAFLEDGEHIPSILTFILLAGAFGMRPAEFLDELDRRLREHGAPEPSRPV